MTNSIPELKRPVRRRLKKIAQYNQDANYRRRAKAILLLHEGYKPIKVSQILCASRTSIRKWVKFFNQFGESGLVPEQRGRQTYSINDLICSRLLRLVQQGRNPKNWVGSHPAGVRNC